ncbi:MAG: pyridoxal 5'-phosphate synthase glutaminase subunit PdxT [Pseudomonadota bacterium]
MTTGVLGLQGAIQEHGRHLAALGAPWRWVREPGDLAGIERLIIPGGESTVMAKFLERFAMTAPLRERLAAGMPAWGICAGAILLAQRVDGCPGVLQAMPMTVVRNAYGRQDASDEYPIDIPALNRPGFPAMFIRAPRVTAVDNGVDILARRGDDPVFLVAGALMATTFHPELSDDSVFHEYFLRI